MINKENDEHLQQVPKFLALVSTMVNNDEEWLMMVNNRITTINKLIENTGYITRNHELGTCCFKRFLYVNMLANVEGMRAGGCTLLR